MTFEDILKSSFPENVNAIPVFDMVLSFATYSLGMSYPINTPASGEVMKNTCCIIT